MKVWIRTGKKNDASQEAPFETLKRNDYSKLRGTTAI